MFPRDDDAVGIYKSIPSRNHVSSVLGRSMYVTDWAAGKLYAIDSDGTDYKTMIELRKEGTANLELIASERAIIIPMMQDSKLVVYY
jgi:hypothetical protein